MDQALQMIREILQSIREPRFFETERGYQGQLLTGINKYLTDQQIYPYTPVAEQEYQKRAEEHGLTIRPDIIIHVPYERGIHEFRTEGNYLVIEIKRQASLGKALKDFDKLCRIFKVLEYPIGIFINIDSSETYLKQYEGRQCECLYSFAVQRIGEEIVIHEQGI